MNKSPPPPAADVGFHQLLKKANTYATGKDQLSGTTKSNKSWKSSIFSWLKPYKKSNKEEQPPPSKSNLKTRRGYVSGPINRISAERPKRPTSGPLFKTRGMGEEIQMPYVSLSKYSSNSHDVKHYGPVYMVT